MLSQRSRERRQPSRYVRGEGETGKGQGEGGKGQGDGGGRQGKRRAGGSRRDTAAEQLLSSSSPAPVSAPISPPPPVPPFFFCPPLRHSRRACHVQPSHTSFHTSCSQFSHPSCIRAAADQAAQQLQAQLSHIPSHPPYTLSRTFAPHLSHTYRQLLTRRSSSCKRSSIVS